MQPPYRNLSPLPSSRGQVRQVRGFEHRRDVPEVDVVLFDVRLSLFLIPFKLHRQVELRRKSDDLASVLKD